MADDRWWRPTLEGDCYIVYRLVTTDPPTTIDFLPNKLRGRGISKRASAEALYFWEHGLSVFGTEEQARDTELAMRAARPPHPIGAYIAELRIPAQSTEVRWSPTPPEGHFSLEGPPQVLLQCVHLIVPV